ncbi:MAG TPA: hypothetical protein VIP46_03270 [Pyrinomonadaceae bacterium]
MKVAVLAFAALLWIVLAGLFTARRSAAKYVQPGGRVEYQELSWAPDGRRISFTSRRDGNWDVYVMNADGSRPARLTDDPASDLYSTWSPDGKKIAFGSKRGGKFDIYVMGADGSNPTRLTGGAGDSTFPSWSPDGKRIAYMSNAGGKWRIYLVNAGGSGRRRVTVSSGNDYNPSWSPDGSRLAFPFVHTKAPRNLRRRGMAEAASTTFAGPAESLPSNLFTCPSLNTCITPTGSEKAVHADRVRVSKGAGSEPHDAGRGTFRAMIPAAFTEPST